MLNSLYNALLEWNRTTSERQKLQHSLFTIVVLSVVTAGIVSLIDNQTGEDILLITVVAGVVFLINAVLWSLLDSTVIARLSGRRKRQ